MGILIQKTNINAKCFYVSPISRTSMRVRVRVEHSSILCNGNARVRRPSDRMSLPGPSRATGPTSVSPALYVSSISLKIIFLLTRPLHASQRCAAISPLHSAFAAAAISPCALSSYAAHAPCSCPSRTPPVPSGASPASDGAGGPIARLKLVPTEPRAPTSAACVGGARALPLGVGSHAEAEINRPGISLPYVANICFKCFIWMS
jgi:hypothetical protein